MAKNRTKFVCSNCGAETVRWMGRCPQCGSWNTLEETVGEVLPKQLRTTHEVVSGKRPQKLSEVNLENHERMQLSMPEVDRPLGGGVVPGSVILWGGNLDAIVSEAEKEKPSMLVIDSIQTMYLSANESPMGSPAQIRDCTAVLVRLAKSENIAVMIIGHVTKEGNLAGPRILEHMVDVVFYLEGDRSYQFRVLRTVKNRFGSTAESGLFVMEGQGLKGIEDPSKYLLRDRTSQTPGQAVVACMEGLRPVLVEIQALTVHSVLAIPRRIAAGYDYNRMIILLAVLERRGRIPFSTEDVYLNVAALGEIGLTGEIMPVSRVTLRLKEALKMKFTHFILSERNKKEVLAYYEAHHLDEIREHTVFVRNLKDLMEAVK